MRRSAVLLASSAVVVLAVALLLSITEGRGAATAAEAAGGGYKLVAPLDAVMAVVGDVYKRMPEQLKAGTPKDLKDLKRESLFIAEMANLAGCLQDRAGQKEWKAAADSMKTKALAMADAAGKKDGAKFAGLHKEAEGSCKSCHDKYRDE
jgi:cytochrome c556